MDPNVAKAHQPRDLEYIMQLGISVVDPYDGRCNVCQVVVDLSTRHCKSCNKCVSGQDHHCRWLNTCIGRANYRPFCYLISISFFAMLCYVCLSIYVAYLAIARNIEFSEIVVSWGVERENVYRYVGVSFLVLILAWVTFGSLTQLVAFHTKLYFLDMTTWEWINRDSYFVDRDNPWKRAPPRNIFTLLKLPYDECKYSIERMRQKTKGLETEEEEFLPMTNM
ncbi:hypothetical protein K493DRAFT_28991 [Basidiobolus meristosporus CBS 931.73]|uniref:Palmitoyltransferase n=1 Tax=Basidiobolus meristosporus CBS 931.73 TaxID=1314790 RepID=A0A1Y1ZEM0_9FUNG|nr:hypothetical protein K493DRAFT_28991 [Basidiobolus meristosporus CBS 931.73]|eukprot:ORY08275.1 hypothetical protein K493DRAFT_28991 [Basidiobolus meristosporus CBS 931.73]